MNADAFRHLYEYHFSENRKLWEWFVVSLSDEQFTRSSGYSYESVRDQIVHMMNAEAVWFSPLRGEYMAADFVAEEFNDRAKLRAAWDGVERDMRDYLAGLRDEMLFERPFSDHEDDRVLILWQVLLHVVNHGTDHRAQVLRMLADMGIRTPPQDYVFYAYEHVIE